MRKESFVNLRLTGQIERETGNYWIIYLKTSDKWVKGQIQERERRDIKEKVFLRTTKKKRELGESRDFTLSKDTCRIEKETVRNNGVLKNLPPFRKISVHFAESDLKTNLNSDSRRIKQIFFKLF